MANCPHCQKTLATLTAEDIEVALPGGLPGPALVYSCPTCKAAVSVQMNVYGHGLQTRKGAESQANSTGEA